MMHLLQHFINVELICKLTENDYNLFNRLYKVHLRECSHGGHKNTCHKQKRFQETSHTPAFYWYTLGLIKSIQKLG